MGQPHEDLPTLESIEGLVRNARDKAETLVQGGQGGSIYQALESVHSIVEDELEAVRNIVGPHNKDS